MATVIKFSRLKLAPEAGKRIPNSTALPPSLGSAKKKQIELIHDFAPCSFRFNSHCIKLVRRHHRQTLLRNYLIYCALVRGARISTFALLLVWAEAASKKGLLRNKKGRGERS